MENKKNNGLIILFVIVLVIAILGIGGTVYFYNRSLKNSNTQQDVNNSNSENNDNSSEQQNINNDEIIDTSNYQYTLNVYGKDLNVYDSTTANKVITTIKTETNNAKVIRATDNITLYYDNGLKYFNSSENIVRLFNMDFGYSENDNRYISLHISNDKNRIIGLLATDRGTSGLLGDMNSSYYSYITKSKLYDADGFGVLNDDSIEADFEIGMCPAKSQVLSTKQNKIILENDEYSCGFGVFGDSNNYIFTSYNSTYFPSLSFYSKDGTMIEKNIESGKYSFSDSKYINIVKGNTVYTYQLDTVNSKKEFSNIQGLLGMYVAYISNNELVLENLITNEKIKITEWNDNYVYEKWSTLIDYNPGSTNPNGIYVVLSFKDKNTEGSHNLDPVVEYYYNFETKKITKTNISKLEEYRFFAFD